MSYKKKDNQKSIVIDIDGTICRQKDANTCYEDAVPHQEVIEKVKEYKRQGFSIILFTSRQMRTHSNNVGRIIAHTVPVLIEWLEKHGVPYDELHVGKPWCGPGGFYVDDKAVRPKEFVKRSYKEIRKMLKKEKSY